MEKNMVNLELLKRKENIKENKEATKLLWMKGCNFLVVSLLDNNTNNRINWTVLTRGIDIHSIIILWGKGWIHFSFQISFFYYFFLSNYLFLMLTFYWEFFHYRFNFIFDVLLIHSDFFIEIRVFFGFFFKYFLDFYSVQHYLP